ncbi:MAG: UDP binding domain-containing protein, partial [Myxococcota bacterium]
ADQMGADVERVRRVLGADRRIGPHYLFVGPGYGGTYFHHDIATLLASAREMGQTLGVVEASQAANVAQVSTITHRLVRHLGALGGKRVALWGLAFKPRTDDIGYSPALRIIGELLDRGASVVVHDPRALERARAHFEHRVDYAEDMYGAVEGADALVLVTEWPAYRAPDFGGLAERMAGKVVVDGRNIYDAEEVKRAGLRYVGLGRHA